MVEFALLYALGFLSALLLGLFAAPAIHRRIVKFTEHRMRATIPMTQRELKAARDMDRAVYAVENTRAVLAARLERDRYAEANRRADALQAKAAEMHGEIADLTRRIESMGDEAANTRSDLRTRELQIAKLSLARSEAERALLSRRTQADGLENDLRRLSIDMEDMRIDLATRETEVESQRSTIETMTEERRRLREDARRHAASVKDMEFRLAREEDRSDGLERKLADTFSRLSDQESTLERRNAETQRLRDKLKNAATDLKAAERALREIEDERFRLKAQLSKGMEMNGTGKDKPEQDGKALPAAAERVAATRIGNAGTQQADGLHPKPSLVQRVENLRQRHTALVDRITTDQSGHDDQAMRREIKEIAASMVSLTAAREGPQSPVFAIIAKNGVDHSASGNGESSLAALIRTRLQDV